MLDSVVEEFEGTVRAMTIVEEDSGPLAVARLLVEELYPLEPEFITRVSLRRCCDSIR